MPFFMRRSLYEKTDLLTVADRTDLLNPMFGTGLSNKFRDF